MSIKKSRCENKQQMCDKYCKIRPISRLSHAPLHVSLHVTEDFSHLVAAGSNHLKTNNTVVAHTRHLSEEIGAVENGSQTWYILHLKNDLMVQLGPILKIK